jgi:predicted RNA binding protein YcfA (HicA-like mRNA interferase family)
MNARQIISALEVEGWYEVAQKGSHKQFRHPTRPRKTTVPVHGSKDVPVPVLKSVEKQSGVVLRKDKK